MFVRSMFVAITLASPAMADAAWPALYDVSGVAGEDVLNVRAEPDAAGAIIATLPPTHRGVEVLRLSDDGAWARVGLGEVSGWAATRYMAAEPARPGDRLPTPMRCSGTEPFWSLNLPKADFAEFEQMPDPNQEFEIVAQVRPAGQLAGEIIAVLKADSARATLYMQRSACSDGMSDREFGLSARVLLEKDGAASAYAGCCALSGG